MTAPVPEETNAAFDVDEAPPGEHASEQSQGAETSEPAAAVLEENAETSQDQPSQ